MNDDAMLAARQLLAEALELEIAAVPMDAAIGRLDAWDSLAHLRLVQALEKRLGRELPAETSVGIERLHDIAALLAAAPTVTA